MQFAITSNVSTSNNVKKTRILLWAVQGLLAATFLMAGSMKLLLPVEELTQELDFPGPFLRFIGVCEVLGALGLILPGLARIRTGLTPLAAAGLVVIMIGATVTTLAIGGGAEALMPFVVGGLAAVVVYGRTRLAPQASRNTARQAVLQPAA
jgi:uncharacterized membrane protein YphA (DoxX/SURF4 family)